MLVRVPDDFVFCFWEYLGDLKPEQAFETDIGCITTIQDMFLQSFACKIKEGTNVETLISLIVRIAGLLRPQTPSSTALV